MKNWLLASALGVAALVGLVWLYVREFPVFENTVGIGRLAVGSIAVTVAAAVLLLFFNRKKLAEHGDKMPVIMAALILPALFAPLFGSLLNRAGAGDPAERSFVFQKEEAFHMSRFGLLAGMQKESPSGWHLFVRDGAKAYRFRYEKQAYFPLTKPGEQVLLPVKIGLLGFPVVDLE